jgi:hypothetical protein
MAGRAGLYEANITWTGNRGQGTSAYAAYGRDHVARTAGKPDLPMSADQAFLGRPREAQSRGLACRGDFLMPLALVFASLRQCRDYRPGL